MKNVILFLAFLLTSVSASAQCGKPVFLGAWSNSCGEVAVAFKNTVVFDSVIVTDPVTSDSVLVARYVPVRIAIRPTSSTVWSFINTDFSTNQYDTVYIQRPAGNYAVRIRSVCGQKSLSSLSNQITCTVNACNMSRTFNCIPTPEVCNMIDDDCNGWVDDGPIACAAPVWESPAVSGITSTSAVLEFTPVSNCGYVRAQYRKYYAPTVSWQYRNVTPLSDTAQLVNLEPGTVYEARIRTVCNPAYLSTLTTAKRWTTLATNQGARKAEQPIYNNKLSASYSNVRLLDANGNDIKLSDIKPGELYIMIYDNSIVIKQKTNGIE